MDEIEIWKSVGIVKGIDFTGYYEVSTFGNVKSLDRFVREKSGRNHFIKGKDIVLYFNKGYLFVRLNKDGKYVKIPVHRLVLQTFKPNPNSEIYTQVNHIDEDKTNNYLDNLEWCTAEYNMSYGTRVERAVKTKNLGFIPIVQLDFDGNIIDVYNESKRLKNRYNSIAKVISRKTYLFNEYFWIKLDEYNELTQEELLKLINKAKIEKRKNNKHKKFITLLDSNGNFIRKFDSLKETANFLGCCSSSVCNCLRGKTKTVCGYKCTYSNNLD